MSTRFGFPTFKIQTLRGIRKKRQWIFFLFWIKRNQKRIKKEIKKTWRNFNENLQVVWKNLQRYWNSSWTSEGSKESRKRRKISSPRCKVKVFSFGLDILKICEYFFWFCKLWQCSFTIILGCVPDVVVMRLTGWFKFIFVAAIGGVLGVAAASRLCARFCWDCEVVEVTGWSKLLPNRLLAWFISRLEFESSLLKLCAIWAAAIWAFADFLLFSSLKQWFFWWRMSS